MNKKLIRIAEGAGEILMKYFQREFVVRTKAHDFDFVTQADIEADEYIRTELRKLFPEDLILSEESSDIPDNFDGDVWMVDPLDGTKGFVNNNQSFSVMIGLCKNGVPVLGIVFVPAKGKLYYAEKGKGAYLREKDQMTKIIVSSISQMDEATMLTYNRYGETKILMN